MALKTNTAEGPLPVTVVGTKKNTAEGPWTVTAGGLAIMGQRRSDEIKEVLLSTGLPKKQWVGAGERGRGGLAIMGQGGRDEIKDVLL